MRTTTIRRAALTSLTLLAMLLPRAASAGPGGALEAELGALYVGPSGLRAEDVAARAAATSLDVSAKRAAIEAASAEVDRAIVGYFPRVTLTARYARLSSIDDGGGLGNIVVAPSAGAGALPAGTPLVNAPLAFPSLLNQYTLGASISVPLSDYVLRLSQSYAAASRSEEAAALAAKATERRAAAEAKRAYYGWVRARLGLFVAEQAVAQATRHLADARAALDVGITSKADVLRVESQLASSELLRDRTAHLARLMLEDLRVRTHDPALAPAGIGEDLRLDPPALAGASDLDALHLEALGRRLEVRALDATSWSLKEQASAVEAGYLPRLDAFGDVAYANPNPRIVPQKDEFRGTWAAGLQLTWVLNDAATTSATARNLDAKRAEIAAQKAALVDGLRLELADAMRSIDDAASAIRTATAGLASAEESYRVRRELFKNGKATSVELTDAEVELTRARFAAADARVDLRVARVAFLHATGRDGS